MGDAPGDVGPGRVSLRRDQLGHVVEGNDVAVFRLARLLGRHAHQIGSFLAAEHQPDMALRGAGRLGLRLVQDLPHFRHDVGELLAE